MDSLKEKFDRFLIFPRPGSRSSTSRRCSRPRGLHRHPGRAHVAVRGKKIDLVVGVESRGFILGGAVADRLKSGFAPVRKKGKLPSHAIRETYDLESMRPAASPIPWLSTRMTGILRSIGRYSIVAARHCRRPLLLAGWNLRNDRVSGRPPRRTGGTPCRCAARCDVDEAEGYSAAGLVAATMR